MEGISVRDGRYADYTEAGERFSQCVLDCIEERQPMIIPGGAYEFHTSVRIPSSFGLNIQGVSWMSELNAAPDFNSYIFKFDTSAGDVRGAQFSNFTINGNCQTQNLGGGIDASGAVESWFEKIHFFGCYDWALIIGGIRKGNEFGHHNTIRDNLSDGGSISAGLGSGLLIRSSDENVIEDNRYQDLGGRIAAAQGVEVGGVIDTAGLSVYDKNNFVNCWDGLRIKDTERVRVIANNFDGCSGTSLILSSNRSKVMLNEFLEGKPGQSYIHMNNGYGNKVSANGFTSPGHAVMRSFVRESGNSHGHQVTGNNGHLRANLEHAAFERSLPTTGIWKRNIVTQEE